VNSALNPSRSTRGLHETLVSIRIIRKIRPHTRPAEEIERALTEERWSDALYWARELDQRCANAERDIRLGCVK